MPATLSPRPQQIDFPDFPIHAGDTLVDVGCGFGDVCAYAGQMGANVIGLDIEPSLVERATEAVERADAGDRFTGIVSDCSPIPLDDGVATIVVATEVMEHVDDPTAFLAELARIGKPGARYLLSVPDPASEGVMKVVAPDWYWEKPLHIHVYTPEDLDRLFAEAGLEIVARYSGGFYWSIWWFCRMAIGMEHKFADAPAHPILDHWNGLMDELLATPRGHAVLRALDKLVPKSQIIIARKPHSWRSLKSGPGKSAIEMLASVKQSIRRRIRDGAVKLGGFEFRWTVRRK